MKNTMKSFFCLLLALAMVLSLAACGSQGGGSDKSAETSAEKSVEKNNAAAAAEASTEYVYAPEFTSVDTGSEDRYLNPQEYTGDGFYATSYEKVGERELNEGEVLEYEGQLDIYATKLFFVSSDGKVKELSKYVPLEGKEDTEGRTDYYSSSDLTGLVVDKNGNLLVIEQVYTNWFEGTMEEEYSDNSWDKWRYEQEYYIRTLDADGAEIECHPIAYEITDDDYLSFYRACLDDSGNVLGVSNMNVVAVAPDGSVAYIIENDDYISNLARLKDGRMGVVRWGVNGMEFQVIDSERGQMGDKISLPYNAYDLLPGGGDYDFCYRSGSSLYGWKIETGESEKILNWINCDINGDYVNGLRMDEDGTIHGLLTSYRGDGSNSELVTLRKVPADSLPKKETLTLAVMYLDYEMSDSIIAFNRSSDSVRIELRDYSEYNTEDDYSAGQTKLTTEILSGKMPDILSLDGMPYAQLAAKGLLEDLYPYLDNDKELSRDDFFPTVLKAMEANGGLYRVCPSFAISTLVGAPSVVGDEPGWTYDEFKAALASMPEGCTPLDQYTTRDDILRNLVSLDMNDFVDWSTGKCSFDSQEFIDVLEFANSFQAEFDWEHYEWTEEDSTQDRIAQGKQMLMQQSIWSIDDVLFTDMYFGGSCTYVGWPTNSGNGNMITLSDGAYAVSASCANKEAAWEFIRSILTEEHQEELWGLPVSKKAFDKKLKEAMTPEYVTDADGNILLDENGEKVQQSRGGMGFSDGSVYEIYALTQEQADRLMTLIETTSKIMDSNESIFEIVNEQAQAYFAGQKSAEEVARLVQSKANLYVNEQR